MARTLVLDGLAVDIAEHEFQEFPDAIDVAAVHAAHAQIELGCLVRLLFRLKFGV